MGRVRVAKRFRCREDIFLGEPIPALGAAATKWLDDEEANRLAGFGKGALGRLRARETFLPLFKGQMDGARLLGIYRVAEPVGYIIVSGVEEEVLRKAVIHMYVASEYRRRNVAPTAGAILLDRLFSQGIYRVEATPLRINRDVIRLARRMGFTQEAILRSALWMDKNCYDLVLLRLLRPEWTHFKKETGLCPPQ